MTSLFEQAKARVEGDDDLATYADIILADLRGGDEHWSWVIEGDKWEIVDWAIAVDEGIEQDRDASRFRV